MSKFATSVPSSQLRGPFTLVTVNRQKALALNLMGQIVESLGDQYNINYAGHVQSFEELPAVLQDIQPDIVGIASSWIPADQQKILRAATQQLPGVKTFVVPHDILAEEGPEAVKVFCRKAIADCIESIGRESNVGRS